MANHFEPQMETWQPRQFLRPCLLLLLRENEAHGYDLLERLREFGLERDAGGLYRTLRLMEHEGLVESEWEASDSGPDRRRYRLTRAGGSQLASWAAALEATRRALDGFLQRVEVGAEPA